MSELLNLVFWIILLIFSIPVALLIVYAIAATASVAHHRVREVFKKKENGK